MTNTRQCNVYSIYHAHAENLWGVGRLYVCLDLLLKSAGMQLMLRVELSIPSHMPPHRYVLSLRKSEFV
jgi:hypothetical protein